MGWNKFYKEHKFRKPSSFAVFASDYMMPWEKQAVDLGCGEGRDVRYLESQGILIHGIDKAFDYSIEDYIEDFDPPYYVYTRFLWHSIDRKLQLKILKWVKDYIFIEARTTEDKPKNVYGPHKRNLVNVPQLIKDLKKCNFQILYLHEGKGLSKHKGEDPHLVRIITKKYE